MKKLTIISIALLVVLVVSFTFLFLQSNEKKSTKVEVKTVQVVNKPPLILLATGKKLGVDFSNPIFAKQTKCYDDPSRLFGNPQVTISAICYNTEGLITDIGWARKDLSLNDYIKKSVDRIAKERALKGIKNTDKKTIVFLEEKKGISYHKVSIGDDYEGVQGTLFIHTQQADALGLTVVITVKGKNAEAVKNRMEKIKGVL